MKQYPEDFQPSSATLCNEKDINYLLQEALRRAATDEEGDAGVSTANILVEISLGYINIYQKIAEAEL